MPRTLQQVADAGLAFGWLPAASGGGFRASSLFCLASSSASISPGWGSAFLDRKMDLQELDLRLQRPYPSLEIRDLLLNLCHYFFQIAHKDLYGDFSA